MTPDEAYLIARMQAALVGEGVIHDVRDLEQRGKDTILIYEAVTTAWNRLKPYEQRTVRHWRREPQGTCDGCGHPAHAANACPALSYGQRCECDEPLERRAVG